MFSSSSLIKQEFSIHCFEKYCILEDSSGRSRNLERGVFSGINFVYVYTHYNYVHIILLYKRGFNGNGLDPPLDKFNASRVFWTVLYIQKRLI